MLDFVRRAFRNGLAVILWINLILSTIIGGVGFYYLTRVGSYSRHGYSYEANGGLVFLGVIIGLAVGLISNILFGGLVATFLNIDENLEYLRYNSPKTGTSSNSNSSGINLSNVASINPVVSSGETWVCKKCSERNPIASSSCKGCGEYR
jgi:hypothetical protein